MFCEDNMTDSSGSKIERIENAALVKLLGKIRDDNSEENMIALLKEAAGSTFLVPVDGSEGSYSFHAVSDKNGLKYMVVYSDSDSFEVAFEDKYKKQQGVTAGFGKYPPELHGALTEYLKIEPSVSRIWVRLMRENGTDRISWLIIAETSLEGEQLKYMLDNMRKYCLPYLDNMDAYCASSKEEFASKVINGVKPFCEAD